jgi:putative DNA primase/helicase
MNFNHGGAILNKNAIPEELITLPQWVAWKDKKRPNGKIGKIPIDPITGSFAKTSDPNTWGSFEDAVEYFENNRMKGVGFVFSESDPFVGIDLDDCISADTDEIEPHAKEIIDQLNSYTEISPSGKGVHVIAKGKLPEGWRKNGNVEIYDNGRYFTITGNLLDRSSKIIAVRSEEIKEFHKNNSAQTESAAESTKHQLGNDDADLIEKAKFAENGKKFSRLWEGNSSNYRSSSEADLALCKMLAFWTACNSIDIDRLFRQSGLYRAKWDKTHSAEGSTYGQVTIQKAIETTTKTYVPERIQEIDKKPKETFHLTDLGNAERLVSQFGDDIGYCYDWKKWLVWDGKRWAIDRKGNIRQKAKQVVRTIYREIENETDKSKRKEIFNHAMKSESDAKIKAIISLARDEVSVAPEDLDQDPWLLTCENGTIDLQTGEFLFHNREHLITQLAPVIYDPDAECPLWIEFLDRIMDGNQNLISFLQRAIGYSLTGDTGEQCFFIFWGTGANGKTTFLQTINAMLGDYAKQTPTETLVVKKKGAIPNDVARLKGVRFVTASEAEAYDRLAENLIKQMTGSDTVSARFLHQEWFDFEPNYKIFLATNHRPVIQGTDPAIWRRIKLIPFDVTIPEPERDRHLLKKLKEELPGIMAWAVRGCLEWIENGIGEPEEVKAATQDYRNEMDVFSQFISDCCVEKASLKTLSKDLYQAYTGWCDSNGEQSLTKRIFGTKLREKEYLPVRIGQGGARGWIGIGILNQNPTLPS